MPMPREEDEDLFHSEADVDFDDADEKPKKKKTAKKKVAAKKGDAPKKKATKKKTTKKKVKRVVAKDEAEEAIVKPASRGKKKASPSKPASDKPGKKGGFGAGLFDDVDDDDEAEQPLAAADPEVLDAEPPVDEVAGDDQTDEQLDEYGRPEPQANYVVHVYELGRLKRTIDREFTAEAAEAFATEFSRTSKRYGRKAVAGKKDTQPAKEIA